ncbi:phosphotransferase [Natrialba sp. PRR66]|nr:phosphotransferase [Natrialba sp. PRR66]
MGDGPAAQELSESTIEEMLRSIERERESGPKLELVEATAVERGFCSVYRIIGSGGEGADRNATREGYLKATPDGQTWGIPTESRIQAVLNAHTSIPVPPVCGVVDDHDSLPSPFYLMRALPGEEVAYERVCRFEDASLRRLARETGEYLAELHAVSAVDRFGHVRHDGPELDGGQPVGDPATLTIGTPREAWPTALRNYADRELDRHANSRFSDLTPELRRWVETGIDELDGPFEPVLGRNDHGLHNLLIDPETGEITAMLDWGYTLAVPAAFDFEFAVYLYSGAFLAGLPDVSDRRPLVREAMLSGYRSTAPARAENASAPEPLYETVAMIRIMNDFHHLEFPDGTEMAVMDRIRADVRDRIS